MIKGDVSFLDLGVFYNHMTTQT